MRDPVEADLVAYYEAEAAAGARRSHGDLRSRLCREFVDLVVAERRESAVDVGCGPGLDTVGLAAACSGPCVGLDLAVGNIERLRELGLVGVVGSLYDLPFPDASFAAVWTMSTLVHVPDTRLTEALDELRRVARPGSPIGIGSWGGRDWEGTSDVTRFDPPRFFSLRSHDRWPELLSRAGAVERFEWWTTDQPGWDYQFALVRA